VQTQEYTLENGLRVVVQPDKRAPVVVAQIWYKVGSADEPVGMTGISHALEHMMFKGTPTLPLDGYSECISKNGGHNNAFTTDDYTAYYAELDAAKLDLIFELEADRMVNLSLKAEDFAQERKVIMEERRMRTDDNPPNLTFERYKAVANKSGPYHHPIIGWMKDIEHLSIEQLRTWYKTWYRPDNAIIVVVGDVEPEAVFKLAQHYFGPISNPGPLSKLNLYNEHTPGPKQVTVKAPAELPYLIMGFDVPTSGHTEVPWEPYALALVSGVLDGGESARFSKNLIRGKTLAASANTHYEPFKRYTTQFDVMGIPVEGVSVSTLKTALWDEMNALKKDKLSEQELNKIKTQFIAHELFQKDSMSEQATNIGEYEAMGLSWKEMEQFINNIKKITAEQLQQVVQKYFTEDRLTVAVLEPQPIA
jgi:zinc protease